MASTTRRLSHSRLFAITVMASSVAFLILLGFEDYRRRTPVLYPMGTDVLVAKQLALRNLTLLLHAGIKTVVDIRPDGEDQGQLPSHQMQQAVEANGMRFAYIPIAHGAIPDDAVTALQQVLAQSPKPALLYCRTGNRAARTYALALASDPHGPGLDAILGLVQSTGHSAVDLREELQARIAARAVPVGPAP